MHPSPAPPPHVLRCRSSADFLAALPRLIGYTAPDSLFVLFFQGDRSGHALRADLPPTDAAPDSVELLEFLCRIIADYDDGAGPTAVGVVISSALSFADAEGPPWRRLARRIERRLRRERVALRELCCVAPDGWISFLDPRAPDRGRPLAEITASPIAREARDAGETVPELARLGEIPEPDPERAAQVRAALRAPSPDLPEPEPVPPRASGSGSPRASGSGSPGASGSGNPDDASTAAGGASRAADRRRARAMIAETAALARALRDGAPPLAPPATAALAQCAADPDRWLLLAVAILTRPEFAEELAERLGPERFLGVAVDTGADGSAGPGPHGSLDDRAIPAEGWSIRGILTAVCPGFTEQARLPALTERLLTALGETPTSHRPGLLALSGWVWWLSGNQTVATRQLAEALTLDPEQPLARMVARLVRAPLYGSFVAPIPSAA
ncbi:DUF4192 family protein [Leucobacter allii]|uniref:DUF4192 family protein n=1 Tax=Leucobacter allii TaxID=2932247 RepID=UPI001FD4C7F9|nr:DUF4192 family protein [Leucobacter allii]UOR00643.1 DUF4192 family protein [Leucobacter allii]